MSTLSGQPMTWVTAEEFTACQANRHAELVEGVVKEYSVPWPKHGKLCATISVSVNQLFG